MIEHTFSTVFEQTGWWSKGNGLDGGCDRLVRRESGVPQQRMDEHAAWLRSRLFQ
jgi:hypothetical protein